MSSSISSSERRPPREVWRIGACVLLVLVALEVITRAWLLPQSKDLTRFAAYPEQARRLVGQDGLSVALVGNSATQRGVDPALLAARLSTCPCRPVHAGLFVADGSEINTWYYLAKHSFWRQDVSPDWMIVTFFGGRYGSELDDSNAVENGRLALALTQREDWPGLFAVDLPTLSARAEFLISTQWATNAVRNRIKARVLEALTPGYKQVAEELNGSQPAAPQPPAARPPATHRALERFLAEATRHRTRLCFVAFPMLRKNSERAYELDPEAQRLLHQVGAAFLDLRRVPALRPEHYVDDIHLTPQGARIYTGNLARALAPVLRIPSHCAEN